MDEISLARMSSKDLKALAKSKGLDKPTIESSMELISEKVKEIFQQYVEADDTTRVTLTPQYRAVIKAINAVAKNVGGIDVDGQNYTVPGRKRQLKFDDPIKTFEAILDRVRDEPVYLMDDFAQAWDKAGGRKEDFQSYVQLQLGIPYYPLNRSLPVRIWKATSDVIGSLHTSLAAVPNAFQSLATTLQASGIKMLNDSWRQALTHPEMSQSMISALTGIIQEPLAFRWEPGMGPENVGRLVRQAAYVGTGQRAANEMNVRVAGMVGINLMLQWQKHGIEPKEMHFAKTALKLSDAEIEGINARKMSAEARTKIVRNMIGHTQFMTENPTMKSEVENMPLLKSLFSYNSYVQGAMRMVVNVLDEARTAIRSKDPKQMAHAFMRSFWLGVGMLGAGAMTEVVRMAMKGEESKEDLDRSGWDRITGAWAEAGMFGPTMRFLTPFNYDGGTIEKAWIGFMPQVRSMSHLFGALLGDRGRWGQFGLPKRALEWMKDNFPAAKGAVNTIQASLWPDYPDYLSARDEAMRFERNVLREQKGISTVQVNPEYWSIYEAVARNDTDMAIKEAKAYYDRVREKIKSDEDPADYVQKLRTSLVARSPIPFAEKRLFLYWQSLPEGRRERHLAAHRRYMELVNYVAPKLGRN
jgi:hypothetical protein